MIPYKSMIIAGIIITAIIAVGLFIIKISAPLMIIAAIITAVGVAKIHISRIKK